MSWKNQILQNISISTTQGKKALQAQNNIPAIQKPNWNHHTPSINSRILPRSGLPPTLKHGLHRLLNKSGPQFLIDPKTSNFNFPEYLSQIPELDTFDFSKISSFKLPYEDETLASVALANNTKFYTSTSSLSDSLLQLIQLISPRWSMQKDSASFTDKTGRFSEYLFSGTEFKLIANNGAISINKHEVQKYYNVLASMGHMLEAFLTEEPANFSKYLLSSQEDPKQTSIFNYNIINDKILVRSQLDAIQGNQIFDLKSRAVYAIRNNIQNYQQFTNCRIESITGIMDSFEREYRDMFFKSFMKYNLQGRMGNMDGFFITYHNTKEIFGFEYISQKQMDIELYYSQEKATKMFNMSIKLFTEILEKIGLQSENAHVFLAKPQDNVMNIYVYIDKEILQYRVTVQSFVNGKFEKRPLKANGDWKLYYNIEQVPLDLQTYNFQRTLFDELQDGGSNKSRKRNVI
ncbi:hypothetical protein HDV06_000265 [Boothiomyces sp. JEL0866]|nr:hypothetical protein HDV06_000265 [Boothiomyces sp. JEL0866]